MSAQRCSSRTSSITSWTENIKPSFTKKLKFQSVLEGEPVQLRCKLVACPLPTILWFHNNKTIPKERRRRVLTDSHMHMHSSSLLIDSIREKDAGSYRVMAINSEGSAESTASLLVSLREEQSANFLGFARRSAQAHESRDSMAEQRRERKIRVELRCVGSPFDKMSKVHQGRSRSTSSLVRTVYFRSGLHSKENESEKESKRLETASERAASPPPMFDRSERFNDRFSDIYCDRRTGARFSDKFSDRCSDRYSDRFSDTESLHNEVRTKLTTLQKAVKQRKRFSISTMSSSEFDLESVASESSYAEYVDKLRVKPASLPDAQHRAFDLGESHREGRAQQGRTRHSFEPQSRTRAIQIMRGELVDTLVDEAQADVRLRQVRGRHSVAAEHTGQAEQLEAGRRHADGLFSSAAASPLTTTYSEGRQTVQEASSFLDQSRPQPLTAAEQSFPGEAVSSQEPVRPDSDLYMSVDTQLMKPEVQQKRATPAELADPEAATKTTLTSSKIQVRGEEVTESVLRETRYEQTEGEVPVTLPPKSPRLKAREAALEAELASSPRQGRSIKDRFLSADVTSDPAATEPAELCEEESLRAQYEKSLEAERIQCEEKLLALRIRKWQQGMRMSEEEVPEAADTQYSEEHFYSQQELESRPPGQALAPPQSPQIKGQAEQEEAPAAATKPQVKVQPGEMEPVAPVSAAKRSPRLKGRGRDTEAEASPRTKVRANKMLSEKTGEERELQLSRENISELKTESEQFASEEEALTQRIMKWQQDVLLEQEQLPKLDSGWTEGKPLAAQAEAGGNVVTQPDVAQSSKASVGKTSKEKFLLSTTVPAAFQDPQLDSGLQWPPAEELPSEGRETRLQRDSEYFVSEEEALAQRILKWQQDVVEQEEVLESDWALDSQCKQPGALDESRHPAPVLTGSPQHVQSHSPTHISTEGSSQPPAVRRRSPGRMAPEDLGGAESRQDAATVHKPSSQRFQSEVREERQLREEMAATRESREWRQQQEVSGVSEDLRLKQDGEVRSGRLDAREEKDQSQVPEDVNVRVKEVAAGATGSRPVFLTEIASLAVKVGEMSEFLCRFDGEPLPTVTWLKDGHPLEHNPDYDVVSKSNKSQLTIFYPTTDHEGTYDCIITNKHGKCICSATLKISDKKVTKKTGVVQEVLVSEEQPEEGEESQERMMEMELQTYMESGKDTLQVPQAVVHRRQGSTEALGSSPVEIRITAATPIPGGEESGEEKLEAFTEKATDMPSDEGAQTFKHKFTFSFDVVGEAPHVLSELENLSCCEGDTAVLECVIAGDPPPEVVWYHGDVLLKIMEGKHRVEGDDKVYRLYIYSFTSTDAGVYRCVARNKLGETTSVSDVSFDVAPPELFSEEADAESWKMRRSPLVSSEEVTVHQDTASSSVQTRDKALGSRISKAPKSQGSISAAPPAISGCGLSASAAVIKVSKIKQAFEADSAVTSPTTPSPTEQRKETDFPKEFIPAVASSQEEQNVLETHAEGGDAPAAAPAEKPGWSPAAPELQEATEETVSPQTPAAGEHVPSQDLQSLPKEEDVPITFVDQVQESPELLRPKPQKPASVSGEVEMVREETVRTFDRTSSFIPFHPEKVSTAKRTVRTSAPAEGAVKAKEVSESFKAERASEAAGDSALHPDADVGVEGYAEEAVRELREEQTDVEAEVQTVGKQYVFSEEGELPAEDLSSIEPSMDSGVFLSLQDSQADVGDVAEEAAGDADEAHRQTKSEDDRGDVHEVLEPEPLVVKPKGDGRTRQVGLPETSAADRPQRHAAGPAGGAARAGSMEEEEVTFGAVYDYYNPPTDWGRPLSPESEMSIEIGSTVSEEVAEVAERFFTPGSSTEVSQPIAESFHTPKSPMSFHTPSSDSPGGFMTPQEYPFSPLEHKRPSTGDSSDRFFSPVQFLMSPADEGIETTPPGSDLNESRFLTKGRGSLSLPTLQEKVQGIPPAFLKPLIKKRVFESDTLSFSAEVFGLPSPEVKWFCNKSQLVADDRVKMERDGDSIALTIQNVTKADQGEYICEAVNYVGEARSVALVVVVSQEVRFMPAPPAVTHQHVMEFDVEEDDSSRSPSPQEILLEVELDENEVKEFEKQVKIITIPEYTADNKSMIISLDVLPSVYEEGVVDFITQEHDDLKIAFEVTEMPPRFINPICDMETPEGTTVMFECSLMGIPSPIVSWFRGDKKIPHNKKHLHSSDGDNHFLKISQVSVQDSGVYTCRAINVVGETLCRASLVVLSAKAFSGKTRGRELTAVSLGSAKVQPQKFDLMVGNTSFDGEQASEIELEFEFEQEADESQRAVRLVANTDRALGEQGEKYVSINFDVFAEPAKDDKVEFKGKSSDMCSFQFQVTETPPKCVIPLTNVTAAVGTPVILQCLVSGKPNPVAQWYKDGVHVTDSRCIIQEKTAGHFNLLITNVTLNDAGEYKCIIQNTAGCIETAALLKVF